MEAASARMAARDRYGAWAEPATTPLQRFIMNACDPSNFEPNLALNLEIVDMINSKKGNAPREAAVAIVNYVNSRNPNVSMLALNLLDICVKNCGYPFHLQISTKEFLNELVRRFPERPSIHASRAQMKILELIEEWRMTICQTSRYKEDLGFIRDMHRLLSYKGYSFPAVRKEDAAVLNSSDNLRSPEEMEQEERAAHAAKLQELIRRGGPQDLQEANKLMKVMAGYDTRNKTDWRAKAAEEVVKVQQKAKLLEERLQRHQPGEQVEEGDVFEELANALMSAHPKIQKMCEEESDDHEAVAKLLEINDSIHRTIERYKLIKKGDLDGASRIPVGTLGTSGAGVSRGANNELSLIDFGGAEDELPAGAPASASQSSSAPKANTLEDDLLGLSIGGTYGQGGAVALGTNGFGTAPSSTSSSQHLSNAQITSMFSAPVPTPSAPSQPSMAAFAGAPSSSAGAPLSPPFANPQQSSQIRKTDPFASLAASSSTPRTASPAFHSPQASQILASPPQGTIDLLGLGGTVPPASSNPLASGALAPAAATSAPDEDEWTFSSSLPPEASHELNLTQPGSGVQIQWMIKRQQQPAGTIEIQSRISNNMPSTRIEGLELSVAVVKTLQLRLTPQSSRSLAPGQNNGITQSFLVSGVEAGKGTSVRVRWRVSYLINGAERKEEVGEVNGLGIP